MKFVTERRIDMAIWVVKCPICKETYKQFQSHLNHKHRDEIAYIISLLPKIYCKCGV